MRLIRTPVAVAIVIAIAATSLMACSALG